MNPAVPAPEARGRRWRGRARRVVPVGLAIAAEAAWLSVLEGLAQEYLLRDAVLGILPMAAFVAAGVVAGRIAGPRLGSRWPRTALALASAGAAIGVLASPEAREAFLGGGLGGVLTGAPAALGIHPAGLLAGVAVVRGFGHARHPLSEDTLSHLFGGGIVALSVAAILGGLVADPWRTAFQWQALIGCLTFAFAAPLALALSRQTAVGSDAGADWDRNPAWVALLVLLVALIGLLAIPAAALAPRALEVLIGVAVGPLLLAGLIAGWTRATLRLVGLVLVGGAILVAILPSFGAPPGGTPATALPGAPSAAPDAGDPGFLLVGGGALVVLALLGIVILIRLWMRQVAFAADDATDIRTIDRGVGEAPIARRRRWPRWRASPRDAVAAYLTLLRDLHGRGELRRESGETPAEHARRLRRLGRAGLSLDLLAADYGLVQFGGVGLSGREERRAVGRWQTLRRRLRPAPAPTLASLAEARPERLNPRLDPRLEGAVRAVLEPDDLEAARSPRDEP